MKMENMDEETTRIAKRMVVIRISTKHINLWMRQLDLKRKEICELAELMGLEWIRNEIATEKCLENGQRERATTSPRRRGECCSRRSTTWSGVGKKRKSWNGG